MCNTFFLWHSKGPQTKIESYSWNGVYFDSNSNCIRLRHVRFWSFSVLNTASVVKTWFSRIICKKIDSELHAVLKNIYSTHDRVLFKRETHTWAGENRLHKTCRHRSNLTAWSVHLSIPSPHMFCLSIRFRLLLRRNEGISVFSFELPGRRKLFDDVMGGGLSNQRCSNRHVGLPLVVCRPTLCTHAPDCRPINGRDVIHVADVCGRVATRFACSRCKCKSLRDKQ